MRLRTRTRLILVPLVCLVFCGAYQAVRDLSLPGENPGSSSDSRGGGSAYTDSEGARVGDAAALGLAPSAPEEVGALPAQAADLWVAESILARINLRRSIDELPAFDLDDALQQIAMLRAEDMIARAYLSHQDPVLGVTPVEALLIDAGFGGRLAEAAVAVQASSQTNLAAIAVAAWLDNPANRAVLLDGIYRYGAVGVASSDEEWIVILVVAERGP